MNGLYSVVITVCCAALICALVSCFVTDGSTKRIINLVMGAFIVCSMILPVRSAAESFQLDLSEYQSGEEHTATADEVYQEQVILRTKENLEETLTAVLSQNGIHARNAEIILADSGSGSIIISQISIYIDEENLQSVDFISELITQNFGIVPNIITV